jgi:hypothetical protein
MRLGVAEGVILSEAKGLDTAQQTCFGKPLSRRMLRCSLVVAVMLGVPFVP